MGIEKDILETLNKRPHTGEELIKDFPSADVSQLLIAMEEQHLIENKGGIWSVTEKGKKKIGGGKSLSMVTYSALAVPVIIFFLLSASYHTEYTEIQDHNQQLLKEKAEAEQQLSDVNQEKQDVNAEYTKKEDELKREQNTTASLNTSYNGEQSAIDSLKNEITKYKCMETCTPDTFVTVDNPYVKAKVDEITAGLTTMREKQEAIYEFVRDEIRESGYTFRSGRLDMWEYPEDILKRGEGGYEDKFLLLMTMFRMAGTPPEHVRFVAASVDGNDNWIWVEAYDGTTWWILDPFEGYTFTSNPKDKFYGDHDVVVLWWFNDTGYRKE